MPNTYLCSLVAVSGGAVFLVVYFKKDTQLRKMIGLSTRSNGNQSFENLGYDASSPSSLNESES